MNEQTLMQLLTNLDNKVESIKDDLTDVKVEQGKQSLKIESIDNRLAKIESKKTFSDFLNSGNLKYIIGGIVVSVIAVCAIFQPSIITGLISIIPSLLK